MQPGLLLASDQSRPLPPFPPPTVASSSTFPSSTFPISQRSQPASLAQRVNNTSPNFLPLTSKSSTLSRRILRSSHFWLTSLAILCQISELAMRTTPEPQTTRVSTILPPKPSPTFRPFQHPTNRRPVLLESRYPYSDGPVPSSLSNLFSKNPTRGSLLNNKPALQT